MNSYAIIREIAKIQSMSYAEKFAGAVLALHLDRKDNRIMIRQRAIAEECGLTERCVRGAIAKLVEAGLFTKNRIGNRTELIPRITLEESVLKKNRNSRSCSIGTVVPVGRKKIAPWEYDITYSTPAEERCKLMLRQLADGDGQGR